MLRFLIDSSLSPTSSAIGSRRSCFCTDGSPGLPYKGCTQALQPKYFIYQQLSIANVSIVFSIVFDSKVQLCNLCIKNGGYRPRATIIISMKFAKTHIISKAGQVGLAVLYSPTKALKQSEQQKLFNKSIVDVLKIPHRIEQSPADVLRWSVMANTSRKALPLAVQRNRLRRQWAGAFVTALRSHGMNSDGSPLPGHSTRLAGTLELVIYHAQNWGAPPEQFAEDAGKVVDALLREYQKPNQQAGSGSAYRSFVPGRTMDEILKP